MFKLMDKKLKLVHLDLICLCMMVKDLQCTFLLQMLLDCYFQMEFWTLSELLSRVSQYSPGKRHV